MFQTSFFMTSAGIFDSRNARPTPSSCASEAQSPGFETTGVSTTAPSASVAAVAAVAAATTTLSPTLQQQQQAAWAQQQQAKQAAEVQQRRRVQFHPTTKCNDGLRHATDMFHEYMKDVFRTVVRGGGETTVSILARNLNVLGLVMLQKMLVDLVLRCKRSPSGRAAILNRGGGGAGSITEQHIPYLASHVEYLETVVGRVRAVISRNEAKARQVREGREGRDQCSIDGRM